MFKIKFFEYLSRKFILSLIALGMSFYLVLVGKDILGFVTALAAILGFYQGGDSFQKYLEAKHGDPTKKETTQ